MTRTLGLKRVSWLVLAVVLGVGTLARADDAQVDAFEPAPDQLGFTGFASTRTPGALGFDSTLWLDYGLHTVEGAPLGKGVPNIVDHRIDALLALQLGLWSRGAVALRLPVLLFQNGGELAGKDVTTSAIGNPALDARVRVWGAPVRPDGSVPDGGAVALRGIVSAPIDTHRTLFTDSATVAEVSAISDIEMLGIGAGLSLGYRHRFGDDVSVGSRDLDQQLRLNSGLRLPLPLLARAYPGKVQESALIELDVATDPTDFFAKHATPFEGRLSYRVVVGDFFSTLGVGAGFLPAIGSPDMRLLAAFGWSPRKHDQDADGVPDSEDQCVHLPEDRDGFQDQDGCADDDNDGDLIVDEDDLCPMQAAEVGRDEDEDGCTDK